jgi:hypothetical protein
MIDERKIESKEYAMLNVKITTGCGLIPIENASVTVSYNGPPGKSEKETKTLLTDKEGNTKTFSMYTRRAKIGNRYVNLPRYAKCDVVIRADGYIPLKAREIPIFPGITVLRSFDLIPLKNNSAL